MAPKLAYICTCGVAVQDSQWPKHLQAHTRLGHQGAFNIQAIHLCDPMYSKIIERSRAYAHPSSSLLTKLTNEVTS